MAPPEPQAVLTDALESLDVRTIADRLRDDDEPGLGPVMALGRALARACGSEATARRLGREIEGYEGIDDTELPDVRRVGAFASPFPVRALDLGLLDPEEVFLVNREKFSQVKLTIVQPIHELETALLQLGEAGVLSLRVPASQVNGESVETPDGDEVFIYVLPREIQRIVDSARHQALRALLERLVEAAPPVDDDPDGETADVDARHATRTPDDRSA